LYFNVNNVIPISNDISPEKAVLVGLISQYQNEEQVHEFLNELELLVDTAGAVPVKRFVQKLWVPDSAFYVGSGKLNEIANFITENEISMAVFDDDLTPSQVRNIGNVFHCKVLDRTNLILDIFAARAKTAHARVQVELAQYQYMLPRLKNMWTHLERQKGGIGLRGPGEKELETDRRIIKDKIIRLKEELKKIDKQMSAQRGNRGAMVRVALVGYTNVGKSTIMNMLSKSEVFAEDKLFATLDTTVRKVVIENLPFLLSDTVGFIRKLPTHLIESFKSTLDEVREADILLHVVDISHPNFEEQIQVVQRILQEIGAAEKPVYLIFNKIDAYHFTPKDEDDLTPRTKENITLEELKNTWMARNNNNCIFISAIEKRNVDEFRALIYEKAKEIHFARYPYNNLFF
jgi:GTPase